MREARHLTTANESFTLLRALDQYLELCRLTELLYRTDFFPGLGWMLERTVWQELESKWPAT